jgi:hypothetical protein
VADAADACERVLQRIDGEGCCCVMSSTVTSTHFSCKATVRPAESRAVGEVLAGDQSFERGACAVASIKGGDRPTTVLEIHSKSLKPTFAR